MKIVTHNGFSMSLIDNVFSIIGTIDLKNYSEEIEKFFNEVHEKLLENKIDSMIFDISKLEFINSTGIRQIVNWMLKVMEVSKADRYLITIKTNKGLLWQYSTISALQYLNPDIKIVPYNGLEE